MWLVIVMHYLTKKGCMELSKILLLTSTRNDSTSKTFKPLNSRFIIRYSHPEMSYKYISFLYKSEKVYWLMTFIIFFISYLPKSFGAKAPHSYFVFPLIPSHELW